MFSEKLEKVLYIIGLVALILIAFGINWAAYESHIANGGVAAMSSALSMPAPHDYDHTVPNDSWKWQQPQMGEQHGNERYSF